MALKPICVNCKLFFRPERNGVYFEEGMPIDKDEQGNKVWGSYKFWSGDLWKCQGCGVEIIVGVGASPIREHYQNDYSAMVQSLGSALRVDDC